MDAVVAAEPLPAEHSVQFYEDPEALIESASFFLHRGLARGDASVVIARPSYRERLEERLALRGFEIPRVRGQGRSVALGAAATMARFLEGGWPVDARFDRVVGGAVANAARKSRSGRVRVFGEIVALLWGEGNAAAAIRVEQLWNRLGESL